MNGSRWPGQALIRQPAVKPAKATGFVIHIDIGGAPYVWDGTGANADHTLARRYTARIAAYAKAKGLRGQGFHKVKVKED